MSVLRAFKGLRPKKELVSKVASLPYDVMNSEEARKMAKGNPLSFLHVVKPEIDLDPGIDLYDDRVYSKARENFLRLQADEVLIQDKKPCLYIYEQQMGNHIQRGILACASVDDYRNNIIKKHELTRKAKEDDRTRHVKELNANTGPVFLTYKAHNEIDAILEDFTSSNTPEYDFIAEDKIRHTLWIISDEAIIKRITSVFQNEIPYLYVADGHHRSASAARVGLEKRKEFQNYTGEEEFNFFLAVFFPHNQLKTLDYNRVVIDLNGNSKESFLEKVAENFELTPYDGEGAYSPKEQHYFGLYLEGKWYKLKAMDKVIKSDDPVAALDVSILYHNILAPILGIGDPRTDDRIDFIGGIRGLSELERLVDSRKYEVAFSMYPTTVKEIMEIADANLLMPPKSTWFEPKLRSGIVIHML